MQRHYGICFYEKAVDDEVAILYRDTVLVAAS